METAMGMEQNIAMETFRFLCRGRQMQPAGPRWSPDGIPMELRWEMESGPLCREIVFRALSGVWKLCFFTPEGYSQSNRCCCC